MDFEYLSCRSRDRQVVASIRGYDQQVLIISRNYSQQGKWTAGATEFLLNRNHWTAYLNQQTDSHVKSGKPSVENFIVYDMIYFVHIHPRNQAVSSRFKRMKLVAEVKKGNGSAAYRKRSHDAGVVCFCPLSHWRERVKIEISERSLISPPTLYQVWAML